MSRDAAPRAGELLLRVENLSVDFHTAHGLVHAVRNVCFDVAAGETLAILGESGSGKSVSASAVMGLIDTPPGHIVSGTAMYCGEDLLKASEARRKQINGNEIAMIFQDPLAALNPVYPVGWQIAEAFRIHGVAAAECRERAVALLDRVGISNAALRASDYPHQFSGGQRQRVMIAMAVALKPSLLIADEPTTALDVTVQARILNLLREVQAEAGQGMLLITHDLGVVAQVADRVAVMEKGRIVETGEVHDIFRRPAHPYTRRLLAAAPGRNGFQQHPESRGTEVLIEAREVSKTYRSDSLFRSRRKVTQALDRVSFDLRRGESLGVVGESGSGKSTLARLLLCLETQSSGTILYKGNDISAFGKSELLAFRRHIQVVFQDPTASLNPYMTVEDIIAEPWRIHAGIVSRKDASRTVADLLDQVGLEPAHARRYAHQLSGGQRQRVAIARALALRPEIIVCDEALSALDVSIQAQILDLLKALRREHRFSCVFIGHDLRVVRDFCDQVIVMYRGQIVERGRSDRVFEAPEHPYTRELIASSPVPDPDVARKVTASLGTRRNKASPAVQAFGPPGGA